MDLWSLDLRPDPTFPRVRTGRMLFPIVALTAGVFLARLLPESASLPVQNILLWCILVWSMVVAALVYYRAFRSCLRTRRGRRVRGV